MAVITREFAGPHGAWLTEHIEDDSKKFEAVEQQFVSLKVDAAKEHGAAREEVLARMCARAVQAVPDSLRDHITLFIGDVGFAPGLGWSVEKRRWGPDSDKLYGYLKGKQGMSHEPTVWG
jgi:hypothetical protein